MHSCWQPMPEKGQNVFLSGLFSTCGWELPQCCTVNWPGTEIYSEKSELALSQAGTVTCSRGPHCASASRDMVRATFSTHRSGEDWSVWKSFSQSKPCSERLFTSNKQSPVAQHTQPAFASTGLDSVSGHHHPQKQQSTHRCMATISVPLVLWKTNPINNT